jgi:hypothetical protein
VYKQQQQEKEQELQIKEKKTKWNNKSNYVYNKSYENKININV